MKKVLERGWMIILAFVMVSAISVTTAEAQRNVSLQVFYDELQPYGTWMHHGQYGYVWMPSVDRSFVPYGTNGYWINTEYGNTWVSDYSWGWAPFHYGRWFFDDFYGWMWVPDTTWGPAWVAWRSGGGYYGWAPLMPGFGIHLTFGYYNRIPHHYWNFVPYRYVTYRHVYRHCVPRPRVVNIINHTTIITHNHTDNRRQTYFTGPTRNEIERRGGGRVQMHSIRETDRPGKTEVSRSTANFYRPEIDNSTTSRSRAIPTSYVRKDRAGNLEKIEVKGNRNSVNPNTSRTAEEWRYNTRSNQGENPVENLERRRSSVPDEVQRREYRPSRSPVNENPARTYQQMQREPRNNARDRYEAPPVQRAPANREMLQRNNDIQRRTNMERMHQPQKQSSIRQEGPSYQRERMPSYRENSSRSTSSQPQRSMQYRKSDSGKSGQPHINYGGSRSGATRKQN